FHQSPIAKSLMHHIAANFTCEDDEYEIELWDFQEAVAAHFLPAVHELAPSTNHTGKLTLADLQKRRYYTAELGYNHEEPRLMDSKGKTRGQLYHWIDMDSVLTWEVIEKATSEKREKWAAQIKTTVSLLHQIGVVWGDVKAENVVIDRNGNAVIIDFEGGATKGWIDKEVMDTKEGDLQGLERLVSFILDDESPLSAREKNIEIDYRCEDGEMECVGS
ncbi:hypothetical protein EJ08DRAFT_590327, partial [Tothia fuscella]